ncbi:MAG: phytanoyl-CoA dioxygenase family protein [Defluviicoccus sp.]|nr:phytanoyl-CoA dioxygenase family protein [Defluviicoccus sp.]MDE0383267.1 phytanoyl-CoA dioxygenase family protein [Defluviicoccus sp.]
MNRELLRPIAGDEIRAYEEDGAVCIRGQFDRDWVDRMLAAVDANLENPVGTVLASGDDEPGKVVANSHMARGNPAFMDFVRHSPAREIAARLMGLDEVRFFYDQLFVKDPGTRLPTAWHHDLPFWPLAGNRHLTRALAAELASYEPGDTVVFHGNAYGCEVNDVCTVTGKRDGRVILHHPDGGERSFRPAGNAKNYLGLFDTERIELRAGERIRWTRNRKPPRPRFGHPTQPYLVNGGELEIVEIGYKRVRFRDGDGEFSLALGDPQLRHLDHAYCTTVHAAQGKTAGGAIAVLDAGGATDQEMFHVEISRVRREFLLLTDDREALIELLEGRSGGEEGALEALGIDPAALPSEDREIFTALERDWQEIGRKAGETNTVAFFVPGYREVMARAAALTAVGELPRELRRLVDRMLAEHRRHLAHDREVRDLVTRIQEHGRRWPELGRAAEAEGVDEIAEHAAWRAEAAAMVEEGRRRLAGDGDARRHLAAMPGAGLAGVVAGLERTRLVDDARGFERLWQDHREHAARAGVPELLGEGYAEVAALGERIAAAEGLDGARRDAVAEWREVHAGQAALADEVRALPERVAAWRGQWAEVALDRDGVAHSADPIRRAWRAKGEELANLANGMLGPEGAHAPYLHDVPGAREAVGEAVAAVRDVLHRDRLNAFARLTETIDRQWENTGIEPLYLPRYGETIGEAKALAGREGLSEEHREAVDSWLRYDEEASRLRDGIRGWPGRAGALLHDRAPPDAELDVLTAWRQRAENLLGEARAMRVEDSAHAPHLEAMPGEREALNAAADRLDATVAAVEIAETGRLMISAREFEERGGGMRYDAPAYGALMERVRALDARDDLPEKWRETVDAVLAHDEGLGRERVGAFLDAAREVEEAREDLEAEARLRAVPAERLPGWEDLRKNEREVLDKAGAIREKIPEEQVVAHLAFFGAAPDAIEEKEREIRERIARDERARLAAEEARRAEETARESEVRRSAVDRFQARMEAEKECRALTRKLRDCLAERESLGIDGGRFVAREEYPDWRSRAESLLEKVDRHLEEAEKRAPRPQEDRQPDTLRALSGKLQRALREDRAELERIRRERDDEKTRQRVRSEDRGFSW